MTPAEAHSLPQRVVWFGETMHIPSEVLGFIKPECREQPFLLISNFEISADLKQRLKDVVAFVRDGLPAHARDAARMTTLLDAQASCLREFERCAALARQGEKRD